MEISEVRIKLIPNPSDRLKAFASVTLDADFVVRDIKIIDGTTGVFVAMPSRKLSDRCEHCGCKNHVRAKYCNECGKMLPRDRAPRDKRGRSKLHADIAHPINSECRQRLQQCIVEAYEAELKNAAQPGYRPMSDEEYDDVGEHEPAFLDDVREEPEPEPAMASDPGDAAPDPLDDVEDEDAEDRFDDSDELDSEPPSTGRRGEQRVSDYQSLIADLKRDGAKGREARHARGPTQDRRFQQPDRPPSADRPPPRERVTERDSRRPSSGPSRGPASGPPPARGPSGPPREAAPPREAPREPRPAPVTSAVPPAGPRPSRPPPPQRPAPPLERPRPTPPPEPVQKPHSVDDDFGAGLD